MKKAFIRGIYAVLTVIFIANQASLAFNLPWSAAAKQQRLQKQQEKETEPMVQTVEEWLERATDIKMEHRISEPYKEAPNPKLIEKLDLPTFFEKYNNAPGSREFNLERLQANKSARSEGVISPNFKLMAYTECYYHTSSQQTTSAFFIYPLDTLKGRKQRVIDADIFAGAKKRALISSSNQDLSQYLFSALTIVDWSKDNKKVLVKEKTGSSVEGIYKTDIWVYFLDDIDENDIAADYLDNSYAKKYDELNDKIKDYWFKREKLNLNHYRWDIKPLGFLADNENTVLSAAYTYDEKQKEHIFLGLWGLDIMTGNIRLLSLSPNDGYTISTNGLVLVKRLP